MKHIGEIINEMIEGGDEVLLAAKVAKETRDKN